jgi:hypothetical protein
MNALTWLESRTPAAPEPLLARVRLAVGECTAGDADPYAACLTAAEELLEQILNREAAGRETALDLLTVDALITYAFEAAAEDVPSLDRRSVHAMRSLGALAGETGRPTA